MLDHASPRDRERARYGTPIMDAHGIHVEGDG